MTAAKPKPRVLAKRPPPGRAPLTAEIIAEAALRIADEKGVEGISTRRLGEELGCSHTAVYLHFPGREELLKAVFDLALSKAPHAVAGQGGWEDRVRAVCGAIRRTLMDHPVCYELARRFPGRGVGLWAQELDQIAAEAGYSGEEAVGLARLLSQVAVDLTANSAERMTWARQQGSEKGARPEEQALVLKYTQVSDEAVFDTVIDCLIDGLRRGMKLSALAPAARA
jgi:AcrR family transcriptional regulator